MPFFLFKSNMNLKNQRLLKDALIYCQSGNLVGAKAIYEEILLIYPSQPQALINLGIIKIQLGELKEGIDFLKKAINIDPSQAYVYTNLGNALLDCGEKEEALLMMNKAISIEPNLANAHYNLARALKLNERCEEAILSYKKALSIEPYYAEAHNNLGIIFYEQKKYDDAIISYKNALSIEPYYAEAHNNLGLVFFVQEKFQEAYLAFNEAIKINNEFDGAIYNAALSLESMSQFDEAAALYQNVLNKNPSHYLASNNQARLLFKANLLKESEMAYQRSLSIDPNRAEAYNGLALINLEKDKINEAKRNIDIAIKINPYSEEILNTQGVLFQRLEKNKEAVQLFKSALVLNNNYDEAKFNLAIEYLLNMQFEEGWKYYEGRSHVKTIIDRNKKLNKIYLNSLSQIKSNRGILIEGEQGIGDQIIFLSMLNDFKNFKNKIYIKIDKRLIPVYQRAFKDYEFISLESALDNKNYDYYLSAGSLGGLFRKSIKDFEKQKNQYLSSSEDLTNHLKDLIRSADKLTCGISWKSGNPKIGSHKSIELPHLLKAIDAKKFNLIDLQYGDTAQDRKYIRDNLNIDIKKIDQIDNYNDIDGLYSLIDSCDLVLTVSNVTAHIAGSLGKKTFLLVPYNAGKIWYWHNNIEKSIWYPSVNIYRQSKYGDWMFAIDQIHKDIELIK